MTNIPTELLRALIAVVDRRSFTKAAAALGITQPAVSAQIKRLQVLLGCEVFDRSVQGVSLSPHGEMVVGYARRLLSINDQIVELGTPGRHSERIIRIGAPGEFVASAVSRKLAQCREQWPGVRFNLRMGTYEPLIHDLRQGDLDLVVAMSASKPIDARHDWPEAMAWARGKNTKIDLQRPIPLVSYSEKSLNKFLAVLALKNAGLESEDVFVCPSFVGLSGAVAAGLGVMALVRRRIPAFGLTSWDDGPLPKLNDIYFGIHVREGGDRELLEQLADSLADVLRPDSKAPIDFVPTHKLIGFVNSAA